MSLSLATQCPSCGSTEKLSRCQGCNVTSYCSKDHQVQHRKTHKVACNGIKNAKQKLDREERELRAHPGDMLTPAGATIFENSAGHFWGIHDTRDYMRARYALVEALLKIKSYDAVKAALDHTLDMLRLCRSDNMGIRDVVPPLFLRLGKDQECYDFIKWWETTGQDGHYNWGNMENPYLDLKDEDAFESVEICQSKWASLSYTASITLIKIRLLKDLNSLQNSSVVGEVVPQEILDNIRGQLVSTIVAGNKNIMNSKDQGPLIKKLEGQVEKLYKALSNANEYFWPALLKPGSNLTARPEYFSHGTPQQMQLGLKYCYDSWLETPGAIDMIRDLHKKHGGK